MKIIYAKEALLGDFSKSIFLAGPTPRSKEVQSWRPEAIEFLKEAGFDGVVFSPEPRGTGWHGEYTDQIEWEEQCLHRADCILFWIPRNLKTLPGFTTNDEWGFWKASGKVVFGAPLDAPKVKYQRYYAIKLKVPNANSLRETVHLAMEMISS